MGEKTDRATFQLAVMRTELSNSGTLLSHTQAAIGLMISGLAFMKLLDSYLLFDLCGWFFILLAAGTLLREIAFKGLIPRLASLLLREAKHDEIHGLTHQELAEQLGTYRETLSSVLSELKHAGMLEIGRKKIAILNRQKLEQAANW